MTRPIVSGIIGEVLVACALGRIVNESVDLARRIKEKDAALVGKPMCSMFDFDELMEEPKFWENPIMMNNLVAHVLERVTMEVANPVLESIDGITEDDLAEICQCTDTTQIEAVPVVMQRCATLWTRLTIRPVGEVRKERDTAMEGMAQMSSLIGMAAAALSGFDSDEDDQG